METDLIEIKKLAKEKEDENWLFRTFLKGYEIKNLDSIVHQLFRQVSDTIDCTTCGNCCKVIKPSVKKNDIVKLSKSLNITPDRFITNYIEENEDRENVLNQTPCPFLSENKCTQYSSRPADCASYPHLHKKNFVFRLVGVVTNYSICPIVFNVYEALKTKLKNEFIEFQDEIDEYGYY